MKSIFEKIKIHHKLNLPFIIYNKPDSKSLIGIFQQNDHLYFSNHLEEQAFVFAPFVGTPLIFPLNECEIKYNSVYFDTPSIINPSYQEFINNEIDSQKKHFTSLVVQALDKIKENTFDKVVVSRTQDIPISTQDRTKIFERLLYHYSSAFCYWFFHPKVGMWMGATPEKLVSVKNNTFKTMALAGTQSDSKQVNVSWGDKEKEEQNYVTTYLIDALKPITPFITTSPTFTLKAGSLLHLCTTVSGELPAQFKLATIVKTIHPTPAVCGLPKKQALQFIQNHEGYDRLFYTGFLGEINCNFSNNTPQETDLYVNLRCMQLHDTHATLYIGCGITNASNPELEWQETQNKLKTMYAVL